MSRSTDVLNDAWNDFKGSTQNCSIIEAREVLSVVDTARTTNWNGVDGVAVYMDTDAEINEAIENIVERHNLVQIGNEKNSHHKTLYFTTERLAEHNNLETEDNFVFA